MSEYEPKHSLEEEPDPDTVFDRSFDNLGHALTNDPANAIKIEERLDTFLRVAKENKRTLGAFAVGRIASACNHIEEVEGIPREDIRQVITRLILRLPDFDRYSNRQWRRLEGIRKAQPGKVSERTNFLLVRLIPLPESEINK